MVRTVIFDLDGTLYDYDAAHREGFRVLSAFARDNLRIPPPDFRALHREAMAEQERRMGRSCASIHNRMIRYQIALELSGKPVRHALEMANLYWDAFLRTVTPYPGAADCLRALRAAGYRVGIGTNMTADYQFAKLDRLGLLEYIDFLLSSEEAGAEKPDPLFFARCVEKAGCPASDCVFVGDNPVHDAAGAAAAGMRAVWFRPKTTENGNGRASGNDTISGNGRASGNDIISGNGRASGNDTVSGNGRASWNGSERGGLSEIPTSGAFAIPRELPPEAADVPRIARLAELPPLLAGLQPLT